MIDEVYDKPFLYLKWLSVDVRLQEDPIFNYVNTQMFDIGAIFLYVFDEGHVLVADNGYLTGAKQCFPGYF
jgi:hypothetical protein